MNVDYKITFEPLRCCMCSFQFAIPEDVKRRWQSDGKTFYCPSCKTPQGWYEDTDKEKLKRNQLQIENCRKILTHKKLKQPERHN